MANRANSDKSIAQPLRSTLSSTLTWIDHDPESRKRILQILEKFREQDSRDELGIGSIRDNFADQLFPGTSTIQTRLRYMLFVPWTYRNLEKRKRLASRFKQQADEKERDIIGILIKTVPGKRRGIIGERARQEVKRLPSSIYWAGLEEWGIRLCPYSQDQYHRQIEAIYKARERQEKEENGRTRQGDDPELTTEAETLTWHRGLPEAPKDYPNQVDFNLTLLEAQFLRDRIQEMCPGSLLAHLALNCQIAGDDMDNVAFPWEHPDRNGFSKEHQELLDHARLFSVVMHGAALIYNIELAREREAREREEHEWSERQKEYEDRLKDWMTKDIDLQKVKSWSMARFWELAKQGKHAAEQGKHTITCKTQRFVERWIDLLIAHGRDTKNLNDPSARMQKLIEQTRELIRDREQRLKGHRSRFKNRQALKQWKGDSGLVPINYRWPTARRFLEDLYNGLQRSKGTQDENKKNDT